MDLVASAMNKLLPVLESSFSRNLLSSHINGSLNLDGILATYKSLIVPDLNESITGVSGYKIASVLLRNESNSLPIIIKYLLCNAQTVSNIRFFDLKENPVQSDFCYQVRYNI